MTTRTWIGGHPGNGARNPQNWSPTGAPRPGDNLTMQSGNMNLAAGHNLSGDELHLTGQVGTGAFNFNMHDGGVLNVGGQAFFGDPLTIGVGSSGNHLNSDNLLAINGTINVAAFSNLVVTGTMNFAYNGRLEGQTVGPGTRGTITNNGDISIAQGDISAHVKGHGTLELHNYHDGTGAQTITGAIDEGQNVMLVSHQHATYTELVHPESFKASLEIAPLTQQDAAFDVLMVDGVHAARMDIRGDMLSLKGPGGRTLWQDHVQMPASYSASMTNTAQGTQIAFGPTHFLS